MKNVAPAYSADSAGPFEGMQQTNLTILVTLLWCMFSEGSSGRTLLKILIEFQSCDQSFCDGFFALLGFKFLLNLF